MFFNWKKTCDGRRAECGDVAAGFYAALSSRLALCYLVGLGWRRGS
jgi:hypothetical protein